MCPYPGRLSPHQWSLIWKQNAPLSQHSIYRRLTRVKRSEEMLRWIQAAGNKFLQHRHPLTVEVIYDDLKTAPTFKDHHDDSPEKCALLLPGHYTPYPRGLPSNEVFSRPPQQP
jgi:hypothetical protein